MSVKFTKPPRASAAKHNIFLGWAIKAALKMEVFQPDHVAGLLQTKCSTSRRSQGRHLQRQQALRYLWKQTEKIEFNDEWRQRIDSYKNRMYNSSVTRPTRKKPGSATSRTRNGRSGSGRSQLRQ